MSKLQRRFNRASGLLGADHLGYGRRGTTSSWPTRTSNNFSYAPRADHVATGSTGGAGDAPSASHLCAWAGDSRPQMGM